MPLKLWMVFEAVAPDKQSLEDSLEDHVKMLEDDEAEVEVLESEVDEVSEVENPHPGLEEGFSQVAELMLEVDDFTKAIETVINYGPTYVQIEGPDNYEMGLGEAQDALQSVANTMHQYAQMGAGGVMISKASEGE